MKIEITKCNNNPVAEFFSSPSNTPETDAFLRDLNDYSDVELRAMTEHARKLERERDEAREQDENLKLQLGLWEDGNLISEETLGEIRLLNEQINGAFRERDEAREAMREAWLAMDEIDGTDRMVEWQNKHANILEGAK
jgi:hypothetical protein